MFDIEVGMCCEFEILFEWIVCLSEFEYVLRVFF